MSGGASPCTNLCVIDSVTGFCIGCGRTAQEISAWPTLSAAQRATINSRLADRLRHMTSKDARPRRRHARTTAS